MNVRLIAITQPVIPEAANAGDLVAYAARVSNPANQANTLTAPKLLSYLMRNHHWSPFEMASMTIEITTTRDIARQILRHRSFSFQEFSQRYAEVVADPVIREARLQDVKNRQASNETDDQSLQLWWEHAQLGVASHANQIYGEALGFGIAKEVARSVLGEGLTPTTMYMAGTIRSFIHYVLERTKAGTQKEHRDIATKVEHILYDQFPALQEPMQMIKPLSDSERAELLELRGRIAGLEK